MTVSWVALLPRQWPAQPGRCQCCFQGRLEDGKRLTILGRAVAVRVVAAEEHGALVGGDDARVPADGASNRGIAKVLAGELGLGAPAEQVVTGVGGELDRLLQAGLELVAEGGVAGGVDGEVGLPALGPVVGGAGLDLGVGVDGHGDGGVVCGTGHDRRGGGQGQEQQGCGGQVGEHVGCVGGLGGGSFCGLAGLCLKVLCLGGRGETRSMGIITTRGRLLGALET
jgi:hypothetical protein